MSPKVSIIIPVYNGSAFMREAIDSALGQDYSDFEVLVVNDGSDDRGQTASIARTYGDKIRYFEKSNGGVATALNLGIKEMSGDYFSWLSHDDVYCPEKLSAQIGFLEKLPDRDVILYSDFHLIDEDSKLIRTKSFDHDMLNRKPLYSLLRHAVHGCSLLIPRIAFERVGTFDPKLRTTQDYDLWFRMFQEFRFIHIPIPLIKGRMHSAQVTNTHPKVAVEGDALFIRFASSVSKAEMIEYEGSVYRFLKELENHLAQTPYLGARKFVANLAEAELAQKDFSLHVNILTGFKSQQVIRDAPLRLSRQPPRVYAVTHWKAGSQWIGHMLKECAPARFVTPKPRVEHLKLAGRPSGEIFANVYLSRDQLLQLHPESVSKNSRQFVVIRDLRDTLVSLLFSMRHSHPVRDEGQELMRSFLLGLSVEKGLLYLISRDTSLERIIRIQRSWLHHPLLIRYEHFVQNPYGNLLKVCQHCEIPVSEAHVFRVARRNSFERKSGRARGTEDVNSHLRKAQPGDWVNHFTPKVERSFLRKFESLLVQTGYKSAHTASLLN